MSKLKVGIIILGVFIVAILAFIKIMMPLSVEDVSKCDGMAEKFSEFKFDNNLVGVEYRYCIPKSGLISQRLPELVVYVESDKDFLSKHLCDALEELKIDKILITNEDVREFVNTTKNGVVRTDFIHPKVAKEIHKGNCQ